MTSCNVLLIMANIKKKMFLNSNVLRIGHGYISWMYTSKYVDQQNN